MVFLRFCFFLLFCLSLPARAAPPSLQARIDIAPPGSILKLAPGEYAGPATLDKPLTLDGGGVARLNGTGHGTVLSILTSGATVRGLAIRGSGDSHDGLDAGILIAGDDNRVENNTLTDVLFGIHIKAGNRNHIVANRILGKDFSLAQRGDGIRIWNSRHNVIENNHFERARDLTFANSPENRVVGNRFADGRYGMHIIFSPRLTVENNWLEYTGTGIIVMYSPGLTVRGNHVAHALTAGGGGIVFKESDDALVENNEILHCSVGLQVDAPPEPVGVLTARGNRFAHNIIGAFFYGESGGHRFENNRFESNLTQVGVSAPGAGSANIWIGNYWSNYEGFDRDGDGYGDTPHEDWLYADRIWMDTPKAKFFRESPVLELLDFLERLAPFSLPSLILRDTKPRMR
jgi:nitrous oxidase accessory protein